MNRKVVLVIVAIVAGVFVAVNPLRFLRRGGDAARPVVDPAVVASLLTYAQSSWRAPEEYVLSAFGNHDIVFIGEFFKIRQNVELVTGLVPRLYAAGVRNLGIEYALSDDQQDIDALVTAPAWDEAKARRITFDWLVTWGYQEYIDLYKAAWQANSGRPAGARPFRVVGLNVRQHWESLRSDADVNDPKAIAHIFADGIPDAHMAQVIDGMFVKKGEKALIYCGTQHIFTRYRSREYETNAAAMKLSETRRAGRIVHDTIGARAFAISLHAPWPDKSRRNGMAFPADGAIDALIAALAPDKKSGGWNTAGTPIGALPVTTSAYAAGETRLRVADLFDGYVIQGPIAEYTMVTPIRDFVRPQDAERAATEFPGVKSSPPTVPQVNQSIADDIQSLQKALAAFK